MSKQSRISFSSKRQDDGADKAGSRAASKHAPTRSQSSWPSNTLETPVTPPMDSTFELPDSTDWASTTLPAFVPLEAALRCEVCKEFLSNPVITSCSHTFCSICIRRCIATDGRCPTCKTACSGDKLLPNLAVREVVMRFQEARPKALDTARAAKEAPSARKRKLDDTDIDDGEPVRQTRSRQTRSNGRATGSDNDPIEVADSEDGDDDFLPEGMAKCPICNSAMKEAQVYNHLDVCTGQSSSQGRSTRSRTKNTFPTALQRRQKDPSPPPTRLSQLNYAMLKEGALRKKLQEIGIPNWGTKDLLKRRHIEWLNIYNANCDADESVRKSKRQLVKELDEWENTQGGRADSKESRVMKKDFDGTGHAKLHKNDFDDLIAKARAKRGARTTEGSEPPQPEAVGAQRTIVSSTEQPRESESTPANGAGPRSSHQSSQIPTETDRAHPYENNESALSSIRAKVAAANETGSTLATLSSKALIAEHEPADEAIGMKNPLGSPARKVPMFALPEQPVRDTDGPGAAH